MAESAHRGDREKRCSGARRRKPHAGDAGVLRGSRAEASEEWGVDYTASGISRLLTERTMWGRRVFAGGPKPPNNQELLTLLRHGQRMPDSDRAPLFRALMASTLIVPLTE